MKEKNSIEYVVYLRKNNLLKVVDKSHCLEFCDCFHSILVRERLGIPLRPPN